MHFGNIAAGAVLLVLALPAAQAGTVLTLGPASGYNVFTLGAYSTPGGTDIQGSVAIGGDFTATGSLSVNQAPGSATPATAGLVVGGNLSLDGGQLDNGNAGNALVGGNVSSSGYFTFQHNLSYVGAFSPANINVDGATAKITSGQVPIGFSAAATSLDDLSATLNNLASNGAVTPSGPNLNLTATGCTLCVFDLTGGSYSNGSININAPSGATVLVNVSGTSFSLTNASINYTGGATASDTLFNFNAATTLTTTSTTVYGSILAPLATFTGSNGSIDGELIAQSVSGETAEFESGDIFSGNLGTTATPEPATWFLLLAAVPALLAIRSKRRATRS